MAQGHLETATPSYCPTISTGIDSEGHAANFVETEQIVLYEGAKASFVQASMLTQPCVGLLFVLWGFSD